MGLLIRIVLNALAIAVATWLVPGLQLSGPGAAIIAGALLGLVNALVRPILLILTFPFTLVTLGLFIFVVNAVCLGLTAALVPGFGIVSFTSALLGALVVSIVSWILNGLLVSDDKGRRS